MQDMNEVFLSKGRHPKGDGDCLMELVARLAGEARSDQPGCASPVLGAFGRNINDALEDGPRQRLIAFAPRMVGTAGDGLDEWRVTVCMDWLLGVLLPDRLARAGCEDALVVERLRGGAESWPVLALEAARKQLEVARATGGSSWPARALRAVERAGVLLNSWRVRREVGVWAPDAGVSIAEEVGWSAGWCGSHVMIWSGLRLLDRLLPGELVEIPAATQAVAVA